MYQYQLIILYYKPPPIQTYKTTTAPNPLTMWMLGTSGCVSKYSDFPTAVVVTQQLYNAVTITRVLFMDTFFLSLADTRNFLPSEPINALVPRSHLPVLFVCISLTVDGPQRARLPIPPAILPAVTRDLIFPFLPRSRLRIFVAMQVQHSYISSTNA